MTTMQTQFDRLDVADFNRRLEAMAERVGDLTTAIAVQSERETQKANALMAALKIREVAVDQAFASMEGEMKQMKDAFSTSKGAVYVLGVLGSIAMFFLMFWEKLIRLFH